MGPWAPPLLWNLPAGPTGQEEAGGAPVFTLERAQCLAPALLLLGGNTSFSHPATLSPEKTQSFKLSYCAGVWREVGACPKEGPNSGSQRAGWQRRSGASVLLLLLGLLLASLEETQEMALSCQAQWRTLVIPVHGKLKQGIGEFMVNLGNIATVVSNPRREGGKLTNPCRDSFRTGCCRSQSALIR